MGDLLSNRAVVMAIIAFVAMISPVSAMPLSGQDTVPIKVFTVFDESNTETISHKSWARVLGIMFEENEETDRWILDYGRLSRQANTILQGYLRGLQSIEISKYSRREQLAYWLNFYNAASFMVVMEEASKLSQKLSGPGAHPSRTPKLRLKSLMQKDDGAWRTARFNVEGVAISLTDIEHRIILTQWQNPRVLYGIACSAKGCPALMPQPFTSDQLEAQLAASGQDYINRKDTVAIKSNKLKPSAIYLWHTNILPDTTAILAHLRTIGTNQLKANLSGVSQIKGESFSWKLNGKMPVDGTVEPVGLMNRGSGQTFY